MREYTCIQMSCTTLGSSDHLVYENTNIYLKNCFNRVEKSSFIVLHTLLMCIIYAITY